MSSRHPFILAALLIMTFAITACGDDEKKPAPAPANSADNNTNNSNNMPNNSNNMPNNSNNMPNNMPNNTGNNFQGIGLSVDNNARGCELVLLDPDNVVQNITFDDSVSGRFMRRGERVAIAFHASSDDAISSGSVSFEVTTGQANTLEVTAAKCFDGEGKAIAGGLLELLR